MSATRPQYRHQSVVPDLPAPAAYLPWLMKMHENGWYSNFGPLVRAFEDSLLATFGTRSETCVTACSATAGLSAALLATGRAGPVLMPAFTFPASLGAVRAASMTPIVLDADNESWSLNVDRLSEGLKLTGATIVMLVAPFGLRRSFEEEIALCLQHGAAVVIDSAAGLGISRPARDPHEDVFEVFSMHATKPFGIGEGGVIFARPSRDAALRSALNFALSFQQNPDGPAWGFNGKMSEFHAAVGLAQMGRFEDMIKIRQAFAAAYMDRLGKWTELKFPRDPRCSPWQVFPVLLPDGNTAESFIGSAADAGVEIRRYYRPSLSRWPGTPSCGACSVAEDLAERMCVLPMRSTMPAADGPLEITMSVLEQVLETARRA